MGADGYKSKDTASTWSILWKFMLVMSFVATNTLILYSLSVSRDLELNLESLGLKREGEDTFLKEIIRDLEQIRQDVQNTHLQLLKLSAEFSASLEKLQNSQAQHFQKQLLSAPVLSLLADDEDMTFAKGISPEFQKYIVAYPLPLGTHSIFKTKVLVSSVGQACGQNKDLLQKYMDYTVGELCPDDWDLGQNLLVHGCEPLPRRRCFSRTPPQKYNPLPLPDSLWETPSDDSVRWTKYRCKSFECLNLRKYNNSFEDCLDCFDLNGLEKQRWMVARDRHDFPLDQVLASKNGTIRLGLDIGGGTASFAARMRERNVTIVTSTLNLKAPFNEFIALRGLLPLHLTVSQRLPFFDNTLDLVHSMHVLSNWIPQESLEFLLYDIDRVIRPGGLFWLERFFCTEHQLHSIYIPMIEKLGYTKLRWAVGLKSDKKGMANNHYYLSALLEKPARD